MHAINECYKEKSEGKKVEVFRWIAAVPHHCLLTNAL